MANGFQRVVQHLRRLIGPGEPGEVTDRELLARFAAGNDRDAFALLLHRHRALVYGVCRRLLGNDADAEDAFQATFLLLARKAGSGGWHDSVAGWLHEVARRTAAEARARASRRRKHETQAAAMKHPEPSDADERERLRQLLDVELGRLPAKYRLPLMLCYLENRSRDEAARELGWTTGTVKGRLERGRELLRQRLGRQGLALSAVALAALLEEEAMAALPTPLLTTTLEAATSGAIAAPVAELMKGATRAMFWAKIKLPVLSLVVLGLIGSGVGIRLLLARAEDPLVKEEDKARVVAKPGKLATEIGLYPVDSPILVRLSYGGNIKNWDAGFSYHTEGKETQLVLADRALLLVKDAAGKEIAPREGRLERVETDRLQDEAFDLIIDFSLIYDLRKPGRYTITWGCEEVVQDTISVTVLDADGKVGADDAPKEQGLKLALPDELPKNAQPNPALVDLVAAYLKGGAEGARAETKLIEAGPMAAVAAQLALRGKKDDASQKALRELTAKVLADSPQLAKAVLTLAQALHSVAANVDAPFEFEDKKLPGLRMKAKVFHLLYVDPKIYEGEVKSDEFTTSDQRTPHVDLPAAAKLYEMSAAMYGRLAEVTKDEARAKQYRQEAETWKKKAKDVATMAAMVG